MPPDRSELPPTGRPGAEDPLARWKTEERPPGRSSYVHPQEDAGAVLCECGGEMTSTLYRPLGGPETVSWIFWRCLNAPDHLTQALPLPTSLAESEK